MAGPIAIVIFELTCISNGLNFIDIKLIEDVIKCGVQLIQHGDNLHGSACTGQASESNDVTVKNRHATNPL